MQLRFQRFQFAAGLAHFLIGGIKGSFQLLRGSEAVLLVHIQRLGHLLDVVYLRPMLVAFALALGHLLLDVYKPLHTVSVFGGVGLWLGDGTNRYTPLGVLLQNGKDSGAVKVVAQLAGGNGLCPVRREIG